MLDDYGRFNVSSSKDSALPSLAQHIISKKISSNLTSVQKTLNMNEEWYELPSSIPS